ILTPKFTDKGYQVQRNIVFFNGSIELEIYPKSSNSFWIEFRRSLEDLGQLSVLFFPNTSGENGIIRAYQDTSGSPVQITAASGLNIPQNAWTKVRVEADGANVKVYLAGSDTP